MKIIRRKVSLKDIIWISIKLYGDWKIQIVDEEEPLIFPRTLTRPLLKAIKMPITTYRAFYGEERLQLFEKWEYSQNEEIILILTINYSNNSILGVKRYNPPKPVKDKKKVQSVLTKPLPHRQGRQGNVNVKHPDLYVYRYTAGMILAVLIFLLYYLTYPH